MTGWIIKQIAGALGPYIVAALVALLVIAGIGFGVQTWRLHSAQTAVAQAKAAAADQDKAVAIANATSAMLKAQIERQSNDFAATIAAKQKELTDAQAESARTVAAVRAGAVRVRDDLSRSACASGRAASGAGTGMGHAPATDRLWRESAAALVAAADDADNVVRQLTACQAIVAKDRELLR